MKKRFLALTAAVFLLAATVATAQSREAGYPLIESYTEQVERAGGGSQNYRVAVDGRGAVLASNLVGLLIYDGASWELRPLGPSEIVYGLATDATGRIAVGGNGEFGYFEPDASGTLSYVSLKEKLPAGMPLGQVGFAHAVPGGFLFDSTSWILHWNGRELTVLAQYSSEAANGKAFATGAGMFAWLRGRGVVRIEGTKLVDVPGGESFRDRRVDSILDAADRGLLVSVRGEGLFLLAGGIAEPFAPEASRWTAEGRIRDSCSLPDGRWAYGSLRSGLMLLRRDGTIDQVIDTRSGLPDDHVQGLAVDREGGLWAALANGLVRIEVAQPLSLIDERNGLRGSVHGVVRHEGELWAVTTAGVFTTVGVERDGAQSPRFRKVDELPSVGWSLLSDGGDLLVGTYEGVFAIEKGRPIRVEETESATAYAMVRSRSDRARVWVGTSEGLGSIRREGSGWVWEGLVEGSPREVMSLAESDRGQLWIADAVGEVARVDGSGGAPRIASRLALPDGGEALVARAAGRLLAASKRELWEIDEARGSLSRFEPGGAARPGGRIGAIAEDTNGNLWIGSNPPVVALKAAGGAATSLTLSSIRAHGVAQIVAEAGGAMLLATEDGLFRHEGSPEGPVAALPRPAFSKITVDGRSVLFGGAFGVEPLPAELPHSAKRLRLEIAPLSFRHGIRYESRVDGLDVEWGAPSDDHAVELTQLHPGRYTVRVRTSGPSGETSPELAWNFEIRRPWYQSLPAMVVWGAMAIVAIRGYARLKSGRVRARARELQAQVTEKTRELQQTVEELSRTRDDLETANAQLEDLSLHDSLTLLHNRRMIDRALADEWARARRHRTPVAVILVDIDHFKLLNDSRGHREGDLCLQAIARHLGETIVRAGDVVARFGGEEFAVLLPNTTLAGAMHVAEQLRAGIEALSLLHPAVPTGRITASFGVAATVPDEESQPESLIESADGALYRAKSEGRNRVCAAG